MNFTYFDLIKHIYTKHGISGFYKGVFVMWFKVTPYVGSVFMVYEYMNDKFNLNK